MFEGSGMEKVFLFDLPTKIYVGTDSSPVDSVTFNIISEFLDLCVEFVLAYSCGNELCAPR